MDDSKQKILVVDDDKFLLDMYVTKFTENSFEVDTAMGGEEVLTKLAEAQPVHDIVLMDIVMPGKNGFETLQEIKDKSLAPNATIIILSNLGQQEDIDKGLTLGADGYIVKASATPSEVVKKVVEIVNKKRGA